LWARDKLLDERLLGRPIINGEDIAISGLRSPKFFDLPLTIVDMQARISRRRRNPYSYVGSRLHKLVKIAVHGITVLGET
jgi:hypothetical protein